MTSNWIEFLSERGASIEDATIRFASHSPSSGTDAIKLTLLVPLIHLGLIRSHGADSAAFLHNLFSNDIKKLPEDSAQWNSFNTPKGRMLASILLWGTPDEHWLAMSADIQPALLKKLSMYVLRSKVKLTDATNDVVCLGVCGPDSAGSLARAGLPAPDADLRCAPFADGRVVRLTSDVFLVAITQTAAPTCFDALSDSGAMPAGTDAWQLTMIRAGLPLVTTATQEEFVAQMLNFDLIGGVSFSKGCYPGQEIVARTRYLGKLKKRMYRVAVASEQSPAPGADLYTAEFGDQSAGKLVNVAPRPEGGFEALAVMQTRSAEAESVHLGSLSGPQLQILELPYAIPDEAPRKV